MSIGIKIRPLQAAREPGLVSIVIPTYNHAAYICDAIQSVLRQTYSHYQIIVVDDGSKDHTKEVVAAFGDQVSYIWQENQGLSAARNTGIRNAKGEFIGVLDADDKYEPDFLLRMVSALQNDPQAAGCYSGFQFVDGRNNALPQTGTRVAAPEAFYEALVEGNFLVPECILLRAGCYERVGLFDESLRACEDWDMWLRIAQVYRVIGTPEILIHHRILPGSMSSDPLRMLTNRLAVLDKVLDGKAEQDPARQRAFGRAYLATTFEYLQRSELDKAYDCLRTAIQYCPNLLADFSIYYELACGSQPKGARGDFATLNLQQNADLLFTYLDRLFDDRQLFPAVQPYRRTAYSSGYLALGLLGYGARQYALSRSYLLHAAGQQPGLLFKKPLMSTLLKSMLGPKIMTGLKHSFHKA